VFERRGCNRSLAPGKRKLVVVTITLGATGRREALIWVWIEIADKMKKTQLSAPSE